MKSLGAKVSPLNFLRARVSSMNSSWSGMNPMTSSWARVSSMNSSGSGMTPMRSSGVRVSPLNLKVYGILLTFQGACLFILLSGAFGPLYVPLRGRCVSFQGPDYLLRGYFGTRMSPWSLFGDTDVSFGAL